MAKFVEKPKGNVDIAFDKAKELQDYFEEHFPKAYLKIEMYFHSGLHQTLIKEKEKK